MPTLELTDQQVVELVKQLPQDRQATLVRSLLAQQWPEWDELTRFGKDLSRFSSPNTDPAECVPASVLGQFP